MFSALGVLWPSLVTAKTWDREYADGAWDLLHGDEQLGHYSIILGHLLKLRAAARILDVGCGSGRLFELVQRIGFERYLGLDLSNQAIARVRALAVPHSAFEVADAAVFSTDERFDAIVFNEVAYYLKKPGEVLLRYAGFLHDGGVIIVSMFEFLPARPIWRQIDRAFETLDTTHVQNQKGQRWQVRVIAPRGERNR